ncbi:hypothetical protein [Streptomyces katrae]|uniref:Alpha/beta hydrolase n=1 Tax=Streptomyces katrae TaxID=68223 RepID=A0A0F4JLT7_9ACTN|nr:hypothetical protein [Streptomyces katrae]KJY35155.1 hypothetical protein VR44_10715 [Streptomyces katrae]
MHFTSEQRLDGDVLERGFTLGGIPGLLWTPASAPASAAVPLILLGHPPLGLRTMYPRLVARARRAVADGFAAATIELPGSGDRPSRPEIEQARADLRRAVRAGEPVTDAIVDALVLPLVDRAVPEWRAALDLFDAFGSEEKSLYANMGGHTGVPQFAGEDAARFFARHLK